VFENMPVRRKAVQARSLTFESGVVDRRKTAVVVSDFVDCLSLLW
jgi:hypothetical protein